MPFDTTAVLVHGGWEDGSVWRKVISPLEAAGIRTVAAPLPLTSLPDDVAALDHTLEHVAGPVILVGHAYAGAVIGSTRSANVEALVYVAALAPDEGETVGDAFNRGKHHPNAPSLTPDANGLMWLPDDAFASAFAPSATVAERTLLRAVQRPISVSCITVPVGRPLWKDRPAWYLVAEDDRVIPPENQHFMAERMGATVHAHPVDHLPLLTAPDLVAGIVLDAAKNAKPDGLQL
ncbi:MAG TPA: alpha/beta hydrolase [Pseudonocardiaceae bacterium]|nr:alpha/beta hydrolase [Pseudonocardiaceae bacterium]